MSMIEVKYLGLSEVGPHAQACIALWWPERQRVLPIWVSFEQAELLKLRPRWEDEFRPDATIALAEFVHASDDDIVGLDITGQHQGTFYGQVTLASDQVVELRPSDLVALAFYVDAPLRVEEALLAEASVFMEPADIARNFKFDVFDGVTRYPSGLFVVEAAEDEVAERPAESADDQDFAEFMRQLGLSDEDLGGLH